MKKFIPFIIASLFLGCIKDKRYQILPNDRDQWHQASQEGHLYSEGMSRCVRFVRGWLQHADDKTGLIPRNLQRDSLVWNAKDAAADNYPFMVLTAASRGSQPYDKNASDAKGRDHIDKQGRSLTRYLPLY